LILFNLIEVKKKKRKKEKRNYIQAQEGGCATLTGEGTKSETVGKNYLSRRGKKGNAGKTY
jgi:hypothetical protein